MFRNRKQAGRLLADALKAYAFDQGAIILGVPRGGVVVAAEVARALRRPLDIVVASKVGAPGNSEFAVGAVDADGTLTLNPQAPVPDAYLDSAVADRRAEVERRVRAYRGDRPAPVLAKRTAVIVDDGIATGLTIRAAVGYLRRHGAKRIVVAAPVMPPETAAALAVIADEVVSLQTPRDFSAVGRFYSDFAQTSDAEVIALLQREG